MCMYHSWLIIKEYHGISYFLWELFCKQFCKHNLKKTMVGPMGIVNSLIVKVKVYIANNLTVESQ